MNQQQRIERGKRIELAIEGSEWNASTIAVRIGKSPKIAAQFDAELGRVMTR